MGKYIVGITGASGSIYAKRVIERLIQKGHHVCICMTQAGKLVVESELGWQIGQDTPSGEVEQYLQEIFGSKELIHHYDVHAIGAPIASGSSVTWSGSPSALRYCFQATYSFNPAIRSISSHLTSRYIRSICSMGTRSRYILRSRFIFHISLSLGRVPFGKRLSDV